MNSWFTILQLKSHIYVIQERLDIIEPKFLTGTINLFLILGDSKALLFDTGTGAYDLFPSIKELIGNKELIVVNSHNHFDHILGNREFDKVFIHKEDFTKANCDISYLSYSTENYEKFNYSIPNSSNIEKLQGGEIFDLGGIELEVLHTPGHTKGSICLISNKGDLFTGDTMHYGSVYLPNQFDAYFSTLDQLKQIIIEKNVLNIYPGHEDANVDISIIDQFRGTLEYYIMNKHNLTLIFDDFLEANVVKLDKYNLVISN